MDIWSDYKEVRFYMLSRTKRLSLLPSMWYKKKGE
jgi:hypothetical protein